MKTASCFSCFYNDVIDSCSTHPLCVFYNWYCLVHNPANNTSPFCSCPIGMAKLYLQRPLWTRLQTNVKVCAVVFFLFAMLPYCLSLSGKMMHQQMPWGIDNTSVWERISLQHFPNIGRRPVGELHPNLDSFSSYAAVSEVPSKSGNTQPLMLFQASALVC